jgi:UDP-N-acetylglucosamine transferase subunit ALG13
VILVTLGTNEAKFDRLLQAVDQLESREELVVQHGPSRIRPRRAMTLEYLPFDELVETIRRARLVITHAGVGSVIVCLANGKKPIVMPRRKRFGEAVDDHQVDFATRLHAQGLVTMADDAEALSSALASYRPAAATMETGSALADELRLYISGQLGLAPPATSAG